MSKNMVLAVALLFAITLTAFPQGRGGGGQRQQGDQGGQRQQTAQTTTQGDGTQRPARPLISDEPPVVTQHEITVAGKSLKYTATTGYIPIKNAQTLENEAHMFYVAYTLDGVGPEKNDR